MNQQHLQEQVDLIREVFAYTDKFRGSVFVMKIDDDLMDHSHFALLIRDLALLHRNGVRIVIIPGAAVHIDTVLDQYNISHERHNGLRITTEQSLPFVKMAAFDICNRIMTLLAGNDIDAVIGNWVKARALGVINGVDYQATGEARSIKVKTVKRILAEGDVPIFPCIGWNSAGNAYNISSDQLATVIARDLKASKIFYITAREWLKRGMYSLPNGFEAALEADRISRLSLSEAELFYKKNKTFPECAIIKNAIEACKNGVERVHILDGRIDGIVLKEIYSNQGCGTMVYLSDYEKIRPMVKEDITSVLGLMSPLIDEGKLIARDRKDLLKNLDEYIVYDVDGVIHGCAAYHPFDSRVGEIHSLAVASDYKQGGTGRRMVQFLMEQAAEQGYEQAFVLTTQAIDWFLEMGFSKASPEDLPRDKKEKYNINRNSKVLLKQLVD